MSATDWIGWVATALFLASYACKSQTRLRLTQAAAALVWMAYGVVLQAVPMIVANLLVAAVAVYTTLSLTARARTGSHGVNPAGAQDLSRTSSPYS
jgi:hypothetical protein